MITTPYKAKSDKPFMVGMFALGGLYVFVILAMVAADFFHVGVKDLKAAFDDPNIMASIKLSLISCTITTVLALWVSVPLGYVMSRIDFKGKTFVDAVLDIPSVLPPLVMGLSLLILFKYVPETIANKIRFEKPAVIIAQFMVAAAFAVRTMRTAFDLIPVREEQVALTLGCHRGQAFWSVVFPRARHGLLAAATLAWARSMGEFGPILIFAGSARADSYGNMGTEVLPTSVFLEIQAGNLEKALAVSLMMIFISVTILIVARLLGVQRSLA